VEAKRLAREILENPGFKFEAKIAGQRLARAEMRLKAWELRTRQD
jgi:F-type H+-transporting ATPase subunit epsilon